MGTIGRKEVHFGKGVHLNRLVNTLKWIFFELENYKRNKLYQFRIYLFINTKLGVLHSQGGINLCSTRNPTANAPRDIFFDVLVKPLVPLACVKCIS